MKPGDEVKLGQAIAQCGNSGNTSGPHVHLQAQSSPTFSLDAQTFPIAFRDVVRKGEHRTNLQPRRNDLLLQADSHAALPLLWAAGPSLTNALSGPLPADTGQALEVIRKKYDFRALAVVVVKDGKICDRVAVGVRKSGDPLSSRPTTSSISVPAPNP